ncbi:nucleotidyl transferase AbiEii/AbiGii toxin family protein [Bradyrhizobium sp. CCGUVB1N3]|uniref:nucleotidyl transferase AbiEii/AbiGii toxin family protein n=1 Tax=Bradyrhizobium sp. CCGUVB1N3 TaxID=2949629 RepID=UPI0020B402BB|nr:nucleotidyl transferase AbiEii/AbiGii toxin family protein [Bradyrhizobium sp. CCGUVB1N3]MCP3475899.1 nucleotidyl transferase AbiEii/AbiGii toxin family protein [Bradyrhizobium sp. CCGUVB1N3]
MAFADVYKRQVALLLRVLPFVTEEECFALKGGTAINLFVRNMPRLSVDIDLTYVPVAPRAESLADIDAAMKRIVGKIKEKIPGAQVHETQREGAIVKLVVRSQNVQIKIEVTPVLRGCVFEPVLTSVRPAGEEEFGFAEARTVSFADLYAGKIVAALDRQHPRDLFDVRDLLANEGITDEIRKAFIVYLLSHDRPMSEVLASPQKDIRDEFLHGFEGMTDKPVSKDELIAARKKLVDEIVGKMPDDHRKFLVSFERGQPDWDLLGVPGAANLPAVKWRQQNLGKLSEDKRESYAEFWVTR